MVSVIISVYNAERYLSECLNSVLNQTYEDIEIIVINDGSTDNSLDILHRFRLNKLKIVNQDNKGQSAAVNEGLRHAKGKYIKIFDADDIMNAEHIEAQMDRMGGREDVLVSSAWARFYDDDPSSAIFKPESVWKDMTALDWMKASLSQKYDHMPGWLWLIPRKIIEEAGGYREELSLNNDFEFSMRLLSHAKEVRFAEEAKVYYRSSPRNNLASSKSKAAFEAALKSTDLGCDYLLRLEDSPETRLMCANRYQEWAFRIYPAYPDLVAFCENKVRELGGSDRQMDGGKVFLLLRSIFGWKMSKRTKLLLQWKKK